MKRFLLIMTMVLWAATAQAENWHVDNSVSSSGNGRTWATAWKNISDINYASVNAGDTIYLSGGTTSQTYNEGLGLPKSGTAGNRITISTGQDSGHNGIVIFDVGSGSWLADGDLAHLNITGNVGGVNHMQVNGTGWRWNVNFNRTISNVHLSYIDFPKTLWGFHFSNGSTQTALELDHLFIEKIDGGSDDIIYNLGGLDNTLPYDSHLVHHNKIYVIASGALGDDVIKWGSGFSFYNNYVKVVKGTYSGGQHGDLFQLNLSHYKIYNNTFEGVAGQGIFHSVFGSPINAVGLLIYNNLFINSEAPTNVAIVISLAVNPSAGGAGTTFTDFIVANNTFVDFTRGALLMSIRLAASYTNCYVKNNLFKNSSGTAGFAIDSHVEVSNNSSLSSAVQFVNYKQYAVSTNNLHLAAGDTTARNLGATLSSPISALDKDGIARPQGSAWNLGAYEESGIAGMTPPPTPQGMRGKAQ